MPLQMSNTNVTGGSFAIRAAAKACRRQLSGLVFAAGCDRNFQWDALSDKNLVCCVYRYVVCYPDPGSLYVSDVHIKSQKCEIYYCRTGQRNPLFLKFNYDYVYKKFMNRRYVEYCCHCISIHRYYRCCTQFLLSMQTSNVLNIRKFMFFFNTHAYTHSFFSVVNSQSRHIN